MRNILHESDYEYKLHKLLSKIENGYEKYEKNYHFNQAVKWLLYHKEDHTIHIIDNLCASLEALSEAYTNLVTYGPMPTIICQALPGYKIVKDD